VSDPRVPDLFSEAAELPGAEVEAWLEALRASEPLLAEEVAALLRAAAREGGMLDGPPLAELAGQVEGGRLPDRIGAYRILRELGRGGMGRVLLAEQEGEGFTRQVALKVLDGADVTGERVRRFRDELRILATLEHPGIARFVDGGRAADGTWFLALEYVPGVDLLEHCQEKDLDTAERVHLFLAVLDAVAYAHERGVVHRDVKPSNTLVGTDGRPRLLDFGISKLIDPEAPEGDAAATTLTAHRVFTPAYASPEQFRGERVTPCSDVFSLGVLFYELLAGVRPFGDATTPPARLEAAILSDQPVPPSRAGATGGSPPTGADGKRRAKTGDARRRLEPDLDAICLKALRRDPAERYPTAGAFAADLRSFLEGRPVAARRDDRRHRLRRWGRRRALPVAAALVAVAALVAWTLARWPPEARRHRSDPTAATAWPKDYLIRPGDPKRVDALEHAFAASPDSVETGADLALALSAAGRADEAALVLVRLRQIPGHDQDPITDYVDGWLASRHDERQRALVLYTRALGSARATGHEGLAAQILQARGTNLGYLGRMDEARADQEAARATFARLRLWSDLGSALNDLSNIARREGDLARGERLLLAAWHADSFVSGSADDQRLSLVTHSLGSIATERGRPDLGAARLAEAVALRRKEGQRVRLGRALNDLATALWNAGRPTEAQAAIDEAIAVKREAATASSLAFSLFVRATFDVERGELARVAAAEREIRAAASSAGDRVSLSFAETLAALVAAGADRGGEATEHFVEARRLTIAADNAEFAADLDLLRAATALRAGDLDTAGSAATSAAAAFRTAGDKGVVFTAETLLARVDARRGNVEEARRRLEAVPALSPRDIAPDRRPDVEQRLGFLAAQAELALAEGRLGDARRDLTRALDVARSAERRLAALDLERLLAETARRATSEGAPG